MPEKQTTERAARTKRQGRAGTTQAGEFVREEMHHVRRGKHGARNPKQAIAIGLFKARRAGVEAGAPKRGGASSRTRRKAAQDTKAGQSPSKRRRKPSAKRSQGAKRALKREGRGAASREALSQQGKQAAARRRSRASGLRKTRNRKKTG